MRYRSTKKDRSPVSAASSFVAGLGGGLAAMWFLDAQSGKRRRTMLVQWLGGRLRSGVRSAESASRTVGAQTYGAVQKVRHAGAGHAPENDQVLAHKVRSEVLGREGIPENQISVNAEHGVVFLRGQVQDPEIIRRVEAEARKVSGVADVQNLLHTPGTTPPNKAEAQAASRRGAS